MNEGSVQYTHNLINVNSPVHVPAYHKSSRCDSAQVFFTSEVV